MGKARTVAQAPMAAPDMVTSTAAQACLTMAQAPMAIRANLTMARVRTALAVGEALAILPIIAQVRMNRAERRDPGLHRQSSATRATGEYFSAVRTV